MSYAMIQSNHTIESRALTIGQVCTVLYLTNFNLKCRLVALRFQVHVSTKLSPPLRWSLHYHFFALNVAVHQVAKLYYNAAIRVSYGEVAATKLFRQLATTFTHPVIFR